MPMPNELMPCPVIEHDAHGTFNRLSPAQRDACESCPNRRATSPAVRELIEAAKDVALKHVWPSVEALAVFVEAIAAAEREGGGK